MKGFKNSTRMRSGFNYPSSAGFTSSTGRVQNISYSRKVPHRGPAKFAEGGKVVRGSSVAGKSALGALRDAVMPREAPRKKAIDSQVERMSKATGGKVDSSLHSFKGDSQLNVEYGPSGGLRPGFTRGGRAGKYAGGGKVKGLKDSIQNIKRDFTDYARGKLTGIPFVDHGGMRTRAEAYAKETGKSVETVHKQLSNATTSEKKFAKGGRIPPAKVAAREAKSAVAKHVASPAPRGHKGLKSC